MGILMEDLHAPTVPSGPSASGATNGVPKKELTLLELMDERDRVQKDILALADILQSHGVTMNTSLTTLDGYPRDDIDVAQIRTTRAQLIRLRNDYKDLMERIEVGLHAHHAAVSAGDTPPNSAPPSRQLAHRQTPSERSFAKVNSVVEGSPAASAGLKVGDTILRFGEASWSNHEKLAKVAEVVSQNEGKSIAVKVSRQDPLTQTWEDVSLELTPRRDWGGRGTLGCHLLPL
jgi:26S proteasome non-ATPase regulatory subunit 9